METLLDPRKAAATTVASPDKDNFDRSTPGRAHASSPLGANRPDAIACGPTPNSVCGDRRRAEPSSPRVRMDCRRPHALEPAVSGLAPLPELFLLPTEPVCGRCPRAALLLPHSVGLPTSPPPRIFGSTWVYGALMISVPAPAPEVAAEVAAESNPPNAWYGNMSGVGIPPRLKGSGPSNGALSPTKAGTARSAYGANRPTASSTTA
jgi:hypothetical protein